MIKKAMFLLIKIGSARVCMYVCVYACMYVCYVCILHALLFKLISQALFKTDPQWLLKIGFTNVTQNWFHKRYSKLI